jgi:hypothetical protein
LGDSSGLIINSLDGQKLEGNIQTNSSPPLGFLANKQEYVVDLETGADLCLPESLPSSVFADYSAAPVNLRWAG